MSADDSAVEAIGAVDPFGHFAGADHTQERYRDAFYAPLMSDWRNYEAGRKPAPSGRMTAPTPPGSRSWPNMNSRRSTRPSTRNCAPSLPATKEEGGAPTDFEAG